MNTFPNFNPPVLHYDLYLVVVQLEKVPASLVRLVVRLIWSAFDGKLFLG